MVASTRASPRLAGVRYTGLSYTRLSYTGLSYTGAGMKHIFLSPHFDDAALSCGGTVHRLARTDHEVVVMTVMATAPAPDAPMSRLARRIHTTLGDGGDLAATRAREDRAAMAILGARRTALPFLDAIYRRAATGAWCYPTIRSLFGHPHPSDPALAATLVSAICAHSDPSRDRYYAPLGVGGHIDHALVNAAGHELCRAGATVWFYEDFPYADARFRHRGPGSAPATLEHVLAQPRHARLESDIRPLSERDIDARVRAIGAYESQLDSLFGERAELRARVLAFASSRAGGQSADGQSADRQPAERYWRMPRRPG